MKLTLNAEALAVVHELHPTLTVGALRCLVLVMQEEGLSQQEVAQRLGIEKGTVSVHMRLLSDRASPTKEGLGLIELRPDPLDRRYTQAFLTPKGIALRDKVLDLMGN